MRVARSTLHQHEDKRNAVTKDNFLTYHVNEEATKSVLAASSLLAASSDWLKVSIESLGPADEGTIVDIEALIVPVSKAPDFWANMRRTLAKRHDAILTEGVAIVHAVLPNWQEIVISADVPRIKGTDF